MSLLKSWTDLVLQWGIDTVFAVPRSATIKVIKACTYCRHNREVGKPCENCGAPEL